MDRRLSAEDLVWVGPITAAIALAALCAWLAPTLAKLYPAPDREVFAVWRSLVQPEPVEEVRSMLALGTPFVVAAIVVALGSERSPRRSLDSLIVGAQIVAVGLLTWSVIEQPYVLFLIPTDYFDPLLLSVPNLVAGVCVGGLLTALVLAAGRRPETLRRLGQLAGRRGRLAFAAAVLITAVWLLPAVVTDATVAHSGQFASTQIPTHAEDYLAVVNGRTPLVDYIGQYANLLPLAVAPLLAALDSSLTAFSIVMCVLSAVALLAVYGVFKEATRRPWIAFALYVPFLALSLAPWHDQGAVREFNGNYYGLLPDRLFGPFLLAWLCARSVRYRRIPAWGLFLFAGLVVLNNAEFGVAALLALAVGLGAGWERSLPLRPKLVGLASQAAAGLIGALALVCAITLARTGELPDPTLLTYYDRLFLRESYGLLPMPSLGLHWAMYGTYAAALLIAAARYVREATNRTLTAMLAFSGTFGLVTGMYFVGRSVPFQLMILFPVWALSLALVAWTAARALSSAGRDRNRLRRLLVPAAAALIGFGVMVAEIDRLSPPWTQVDRLADGGRAAYDTPNAQRFVESHTEPGDRVLLIGTPVDHRLAERAGVVDVSPLNGFISLISRVEADRALDQLRGEDGNAVFEAVTAPSAISPGPFKAGELAAILRQRGYRLVEKDPSSGLRLWRGTAGE